MDDATISNRLIGEIVDVLVDAVITIDPGNNILFANRAAGRMFGYENEELVGMSLLDLIPDRFKAIHQSGMERYLASGGVRHGSDYVRVLGLRRDGREMPLSLSMTLSKGTNRTLVTGVLRDLEELERARAQLDEKVKELERLNAQLAAQAECDPMTGALNRRALQRLSVDLWSSGLAGQVGIAVAVCDIDFFKAYNDHYGHLGGDRCLIAVAQALRQVAAAAGAYLVRFGGEEFVALFPGVPEDSCTALASRLRTAVESLQLDHEASRVNRPGFRGGSTL